MTGLLAPAGLSIRRNAAWTFTGQVVYALSQLGMLVVLARLAEPESLGRFTLALAVTAPVLMFAGLQLRGLLASDARGSTEVGVYVALRGVTTLLGMGVVLLLALLGPWTGETAWVLVVVGALKCVEALSDVLHGYLQRLEQLGVVARSTMARGVLSLLALGAVQAVTGNLVLSTLGMLATATGVLLAYDVPAARRLARAHGDEVDPVVPVLAPAVMRRLACTAMPLGAVMLLVSLATMVPRYAVEAHLGEASLGVFSAIAYAMVVLAPV